MSSYYDTLYKPKPSENTNSGDFIAGLFAGIDSSVKNNGGNRIIHLSSYTKTGGVTGEIGDVVFAENVLYSYMKKAKFAVM